MKKNWLYMLLLAISLEGGIVSCSSENIEQVSEHTEGTPIEITFSVSAGSDMTSRTPVITPDDDLRGKQHVTRVWLYIYSEEGECLSVEEVEWYKDDSVGAETKSRRHQLKYKEKLNPNEVYTLLAIGVDDRWNGTEFEKVNSAKTYNLPEAMELQSLWDNSVELAESLTRRDIAESELFAGHIVKTGREILEGRGIEINLYRRVAGVSFAFRNIPKKIGEEEVYALVIRICGAQNTSAYLRPQLPQGMEGTEPKYISDEDFVDFINSPLRTKDADLLFFVKMQETSALGPGTGDTGNEDSENSLDPHDPEYPSDPTDPIDTETENWRDPIIGGRYVLPAKYNESYYQDLDNGHKRSTLMLELWGKEGNVLLQKALIITKTIGLTRGGTGIIEGSKSRYQYPLRPNQFYRIGKKGDEINLSGEETEIEIEIDEVWDEYYGGAMDGSGSSSGTGMDNSWGEHEGGNLVTE